MTTTQPAGILSGFCGGPLHSYCPVVVAGHPCVCDCHQEPEPDAAALYATVTHSAGVASVGYAGKLAQALCSCGWTATEPHQRNHDAFDDARAHLAAAAGQVTA